MDLDAVRTFVAVADTGRFQAAGDELALTQQAVSKRVAALERDLGVRLFVRGPKGVRLSVDGQAFLPHARELLRVENRAVASVLPASRALRVDVVNRRIAPAVLLQAFHRQHPEIDLDVVTLPLLEGDEALAALADGTVDLTFRALAATAGRAPAGLRAGPALYDRHELLVGPRHPLADRRQLELADLVDHPIWMFPMPPASEPGAYYRELAANFGLTIDSVAPNFGNEALLAELAGSPRLATLVGRGSRYLWPATYDLRRIPVVAPTPVYPLYPLWSAHSAHEALPTLLAFLRSRSQPDEAGDLWLPTWSSFTAPTIVRP
ncbi:DNA-binding transcriptional regulator, LysR family [Actinopolymorpha cephalotaxi]|uniref:DNA-binding transcriptional LysR family regulator n=1 Tax=Actinopolymorpha cephalotaxi TaxID=504797 RepID=A0A1I2N3C9_9ACTN|nr:LysR family transcriptional regulator [Actinopolymorpha cephalotaxi]NYH85697.1 DNA-binding transcriptional LysR family regulator [Actinopolymorpha cephalotaxi]SFF98415.1 DNA-binding transcriptional regulator, LysR family [Actinopolymorpha cephalotaxi]